jgi:hypothetical protein
VDAHAEQLVFPDSWHWVHGASQAVQDIPSVVYSPDGQTGHVFVAPTKYLFSAGLQVTQSVSEGVLQVKHVE